jgi:DNA repair photolyase
VAPRTLFLRDPARSIIVENDSPDVGFHASINPYRGCEHGCVYCFARPTHEYLGWSAGLDFETRILVKEEAPALLRREIAARGYRPQVLGLSGVTDPYQPVERTLRLTRGCLEVLARHRHPVTIITKSHLVTRDGDLLGELARHGAGSVMVSLTTLDPELAARMEPRASRPARRLEAIAALAAAGVPVGVLVAPVVPALTDHELPALLEAAAAAGASAAGYVVLRLPHGVKELFLEWVAAHYPLRRAKVEARVRELWEGELYDPTWHVRQRGQGPFAEQLRALFAVACRRAGLAVERTALSTGAFRRPGGEQPSLFPH